MFRKKESEAQRALQKIRHAEELSSIRYSVLRLDWLAAEAKQKIDAHALPIVREQYGSHVAALLDDVQDIRRNIEYFDNCVKNHENKQLHHLQGIFQGMASKGKQIQECAQRVKIVHALHPGIGEIDELSGKIVTNAGIILRGHLR